MDESDVVKLVQRAVPRAQSGGYESCGHFEGHRSSEEMIDIPKVSVTLYLFSGNARLMAMPWGPKGEPRLHRTVLPSPTWTQSQAFPALATAVMLLSTWRGTMEQFCSTHSKLFVISN